MDQSTDQMPQKLEFLIQADGAFFALARFDNDAVGSHIQLFLDNGKGEVCGAVPGVMGRGSSDKSGNGGTVAVVFCADSTLLTDARYYRLGDRPRQKLAPVLRHVIAPDKAWNPPSPARPLQFMNLRVRRALFLIRSGEFSELWEASWAKITRRARPGRPVPPAPPAPVDALQLWMQEQVLAQERLVLIVDHGLGGGATHYGRKLLERHLQLGDAVLLITSEPSVGMYELYLHTAEGKQHQRTMSLAALLQVPAWPNLRQIVYNTAALFVSPLAMVALLLHLQQRSGARLTVLFHDYFPVCPSIFLISPRGRYCGIPDAATCRRCMPQNPGLPELLLHYRHYDPILWRQVWECLLLVADEMTAFSQASADIVRKVWPWVDASRRQVVPHQAEPLNAEPVVVRNTQGLHIGIVGQLGFHKGIDVITALAKAIRRRKKDVRISVIGSVEAPVDSRVISQSGPYKREDLPRLIAESGANVMLFPSVWPETFSYVVQELMALNLPLACFDMGAPAERVRTYAKGLILEDADAEALLDQLLAFFERQYASR